MAKVRVDIDDSFIIKAKKYQLKKTNYHGFISGSQAVEFALNEVLNKEGE